MIISSVKFKEIFRARTTNGITVDVLFKPTNFRFLFYKTFSF